ncbi:MAG: tRNA uridine-5-carboxymethylaminomethyl(34) synthesis GTPase MnmE [Synergistaceae bacterium]|nr:tRNA uridine-5-carboxymethylaminomethyl(34) synthesis GTPase MnmE [Synergistaceae bacterium]
MKQEVKETPPHRFGGTIAAISTAQGEAGIAIIRMSGPASVSIAEKILKSPSSKSKFKSNSNSQAQALNNFKFKSPRVMSLAVLYLNNSPADYVLSVYFKSPFSFTGEDMVELHTHGGSLIAKLCLEELLKHGARLAEPSEFTRRAFLNNKIDLSQAESVLGIIKARSEEALKSAARVMSGELSNKILEIRDEILNIQGSIEIGLDFPEGEEPLINNLELLEQVNKIILNLSNLISDCKTGFLLREGAGVVIAGRPNVGKSSLLNALLNRRRAIVTDIPGTTRDIIEEAIIIDGVYVRLIDTAGLRETDNIIEADGINLAREALNNADVKLWLMDASKEPDAQDLLYLQKFLDLNLDNCVIVLNKSDLEPKVLNLNLNKDLRIINISAKTGYNLDKLKNLIINLIVKDGSLNSGLNVSSKQLEELKSCENNLAEIKEAVVINAGEVIIADLLNSARLSLERVLGIESSEVLLNSIFSRFCVGK